MTTPGSQNVAFDLSLDAWGKLVLIDAAGERHVGVTPVRVFPTTDAHQWVSIVSSQGKELALVEDLTALPPQVRDLLELAMSQREFMPEILQILYVSSIMEPCDFEVITDRGPTRFVLKSEDDVRRLSPHSGIIVDAHGVRYLVRDTRKLDLYGRRALEQYI
jgi:hypothetical protein